MGRGWRLDAHERHLYLSVHLACEVADPRRDFQARAQSTRGESLALRRVVPSPKKICHAQARSLKVYVKLLRISVRYNISERVCVVFKQLSLGVRVNLSLNRSRRAQARSIKVCVKFLQKSAS